MLLSYLKIAWKVLLRRKFFTAISLFGISFTLMIMLVVYAMFDYVAGPHRPELKADRLLFVSRMQLVYREGGTSNSNLGYDFLERHLRTLKTPEKVSLSLGNFSTVTAYVGDQTLKLDRKFTDGEFWQVLDFDYVAGRPYNAREVRDAAHVAVLNETTARRYFGNVAAAVGRPVELDAVRYQVVGVVRDVSISRINTYAEAWLPITLSTDNLRDPSYLGRYQAIVLARQAADVPLVQQEYQRVIDHLPLPDPKQYKQIRSYAHTLLGTLTARFNMEGGPEGGAKVFTRAALVLGLLFLLLPALNLVNINVSRTLERASEIGVRKAFGATGGRLVGQFLVENIFLTLLGGILGLGLAAGALALLNSSHFIPYATYALNERVFGAALVIVLFFGILSGAYPAYKMSKLHPVKALKGDAGS
ncbi:FtsX-like permease family protein [Hymenobacter setariae]|uniref:FtsX-like permease family protein n=1 Tax=Hymenobacter setariae TaxID=2594794 RepID=A0A558BMM3_9BACT|nr:ABC transporter permease [Hymenobacter setariae]TVT37767.1 FtsX-like permease family protein [Hymenobacter setariae]